jgi:glycine oxidase
MGNRSGPRVLVVGGGVVGLSIARELAGAGADVTVLERRRLGSEASSAAAGILCPQHEATSPSPLVDLGMESLRLFRDFVAALDAETGIDPELDTGGTLRVDQTREDEAETAALIRWQQAAGWPVERLSSSEVAGREPGLGETVLGAAYFPRGGRVEPRLLMKALEQSVRRRGVKVREGAPVVGLHPRRAAVGGVILAGGETLESDRVIVAAGAWSSMLLPEVPVQVFPVKGQMLVVQSRRPVRRHVVVSPRVYRVPRRDGTVLLGSTMERSGFAKEVTPRAMLRLTAAALALDPGLEDSAVRGTWAGLRPGTEDGLPILGPVREGLIAATGHHRSGILLAPVTAALMAETVLRGATTRPLDPFSPFREPIPGNRERPA